ncbi:2-oxoacid:acceptor oxidoreductase subunit alpha [Thermanaerosceptrum fracticalcis]|uniref:2-oxoacid:acceptor oxidoreductase subunit alpha n=1 Tax=Thermanaerosceptrum fracticalcis TaxID=1712410 RepID=A0A7G6E541_THEFR|nr:2-oxoacid:acceptor oxidoreductase subunit alpha [Thermanaerosceptrum fracticalcis]QNB47195.1 2-oxoacid:acceptor oxidoreductase subunit alpha [Thermanaerosceptrum fracticalcis]
MAQNKILQGNEACAEAALLAGCRFFAGYPITPSTEIAEIMANELPKVGGVFIQMEDEIASAMALVGASWGGSKPMTATSGPGICLMTESLGCAVVMETPCVFVNVMRCGPSSGAATAPSQGDVFQAKYGSNGDYSIIALAPSNAQEMFDLTIRAFNLAEKYRTPVFILTDEVVAHTRERVVIPAKEEIELVERKKPDCPPEAFVIYKPDANGVPMAMPAFNEGYKLSILSTPHDENGFKVIDVSNSRNAKIASDLNNRLIDKIEKNVDDIAELEETFIDDAEIIVISYGSVARASLNAVKTAREKGYKVGNVKLKTLWPFPQERIKKYLMQAKRVIVPEMNAGQVVLEIERVNQGYCQVVSLPKLGGQYHNPSEILSIIMGGE